MHTTSKTYGIGEITSESDTKYNVVFEDGTEKSILKSFTTVYATYEAAEAAIAAITEREAAEENESRSIAHGHNYGADLSELNRENARKNLPSFMRD